MQKNLTELVFILDRSGSMQGMETDTIGGFNSMLEKQKKEPGEAFVSTVLFDDRVEVLHDRVKADRVQAHHRRGILCAGLHRPAGCSWVGSSIILETFTNTPDRRIYPRIRCS